MSNIQEGTTKDGRSYIIRHPEIGDIESAWKYINRLSQERTFVSFQGEDISLEDEEKFVKSKIKDIQQHEGMALFLVVDGAVQGICSIECKPRSESHVGTLGLSLDISVRGEGLGRKLMESVIEEARTVTGLRVIVLTIKSPNTIAYSLYKKLGFEEFGILPGGTKHQDAFVDEIYMYKNIV